MQTNGIWNLVTDFLKRGNKKTAYNKGFAIAGFPCTADTFVVNQSLVFQINI